MNYNSMIEWLEQFREMDEDADFTAGDFPYRLKPLRLDDLDVVMLQALVRLGEGAYDVPIHCEVEKETGRDVALADIHNSLANLEDQRLISSTVDEAVPERKNRARRSYHVEITGELALAAKLKEAAKRERVAPGDLQAGVVGG